MKLCILYGGTSREREVSINTGNSIYNSIKNDFNIIMHDFDGDLNPLNTVVENVDLVFIALHGGDGENGQIQKFLEKKNVQFTGSDSLASSLAMDKNKSKKICIENNILTPLWRIVNKNNLNKKNNFNGKVVVKPVSEGSSVGMSIVDNCFNKKGEISTELKNAFDFCFSVSNNAMIEQYILGRELTVSILDDKVLPIIEVIPKGDFYDYKCKYTKGESDYLVPAKLDERTKNLLNEYSIKIHKTIGCRGYSRVDFRLSEDGKIYFLEINTLPGFTDTSLFPKAANAVGLSYNELIKSIIRLALK